MLWSQKFLTLSINILPKGSKVIFWLSGQVFQKFSRDRWKITIFLERKSRNQLFFNFFIAKGSYIVSKPNDDFHEASFEVYYVSVSQKLGILGFSPQIFFILTSVTSDTSWGQSMSLSNLNEVSNFSWRCQLSYEILFVEFGWKLKHPETAISHRALLDHPRILNWPKSPHRLGLSCFLVIVKTALREN